MTAQRPRLCFVGPMLGSNSGWAVSQCETLAELFERAGYGVRLTSRYPNRALRLADTVGSLVRWSPQVDIIIVHVFGGLSFAMGDVASWLAKRLGKRLILFLQGGEVPKLAQRCRGWSRRVLSRADVVVAPSGYLAQTGQALGFEVRIIPNLLELERYRYRARRKLEPRLLWMRTFHDWYHPELAVEVLRRLRGPHPDARLTMAGQAAKQPAHTLRAVRHVVERHGLGDQVRFAGFLDETGKAREFARHDLYLHTNRVDNMPVSVLEAAACGLPVVGTSVGGMPYLLRHEETGLLVEPEDADGMARAVERLLEEPELAAALSRNGRALAERCSWAAVKPAWEALFEELWAHPPHRT